jgi:hypothetical protein
LVYGECRWWALFEIFSIHKDELINSLFSGIDKEDAAYVGLVEHPWRNNEERRSLRPEEVPNLLDQIFCDQV